MLQVMVAINFLPFFRLPTKNHDNIILYKFILIWHTNRTIVNVPNILCRSDRSLEEAPEASKSYTETSILLAFIELIKVSGVKTFRYYISFFP